MLKNEVIIAFHSLFAQAVFNAKQHKLGGAEKRTMLLSKMLVEGGFVTGILMADPGKSHHLPKANFGIVPLYHPKYRLRAKGIQIKKPSFNSGFLSQMNDKLRRMLGQPVVNISEKAKKEAFAPFYKARAKLWIGLCLNDSMLELAQFCQESQTPLLLGLAGDVDLDFLSDPVGRDAFGSSREKKKKTMELVSAVMVQNRFQEKTMRQYFSGIPTYYLPNPIVLSALPMASPIRSGAVWIGKIDSNKNPMALLRMAQKMPQLKITMVANLAEAGLEQAVLKSLPSNVEWIPSLSYSETMVLMSRSEVHLSTSFQEGFPNTFLEAAAVKTPTISLHVDPDGLMQKGIFGFCASGDEDLFVELVLRAGGRSPEVEDILERTSNYVRDNHDYEKVKDRFRDIVQSVMHK